MMKYQWQDVSGDRLVACKCVEMGQCVRLAWEEIVF